MQKNQNNFGVKYENINNVTEKTEWINNMEKHPGDNTYGIEQKNYEN